MIYGRSRERSKLEAILELPRGGRSTAVVVHGEAGMGKSTLLVAQGNTNREVAASLFLSPKTVEHHLSSIYRRLDVRSRTQLARLYAEERPPAPV